MLRPTPRFGSSLRHSVSLLALALLAQAAVTGSATVATQAGAFTVPAVALINASSPAGDIYNGQFCAGALVEPDIVLTAAHCVAVKGPSSIAVVVGSDNLCKGAPIDGERIGVRRVVKPKLASGDNDYALLLLVSPSQQPPSRIEAAPGPGATVTAFGWGRSSYYGIPPCRRVAAHLVISDWARCARLGVPGGGFYSNIAMTCASPAHGATRNTCNGDSGGPLLDRRGNLVGLTIAGYGCGLQDPGVYLRISSIWAMIASLEQGRPATDY